MMGQVREMLNCSPEHWGSDHLLQMQAPEGWSIRETVLSRATRRDRAAHTSTSAQGGLCWTLNNRTVK